MSPQSGRKEFAFIGRNNLRLEWECRGMGRVACVMGQLFRECFSQRSADSLAGP